MPSIVMDVSGAAVPQHQVDRIISRVDSSVVPINRRRKDISFSFTFSNGIVQTMTVTATSQVALDQVANMVRRFKLLGNKVAGVAQVAVTSIPSEVTPYQAHI
jgi:ribosome-interacting GTPase 1